MRSWIWAAVAGVGAIEMACIPAELTLAREDAAPMDATPDQSVLADAAKEAAAGDGGVDARSDGVSPDAPPEAEAGLAYLCGAATTLDCSTCASAPLGCVLCTDGGGLYAVCVAIGSSCWAQDNPMGANWCPCSAARDCVVPQQECYPLDGGACVTCGENLTDGRVCKIGGACRQATGKCM